jgi:hypothetical protein
MAARNCRSALWVFGGKPEVYSAKSFGFFMHLSAGVVLSLRADRVDGTNYRDCSFHSAPRAPFIWVRGRIGAIEVSQVLGASLLDAARTQMPFSYRGLSWSGRWVSNRNIQPARPRLRTFYRRASMPSGVRKAYITRDCAPSDLSSEVHTNGKEKET